MAKSERRLAEATDRGLERAKDALEHNHAEFRLAMLEIGVLGGLLLVLGVTTYLIRLKEREPQE
jgi:hypothetical protein